MKAATIFTGFDGAGIGMQAAGFDLRWGIELDDAIAGVARVNGHNVITADVTRVDPAQLEPVDALHISPPCTRASVANSSAEENEDGLKESQLDMDLANASIRFVEALTPKIVTVENVWGYRKFQSFRGGKKCEGILPALERLGYWVDVQHVNAADFGVPQSRRRLILRAVKGGWVPMLPEPEPWVGWYEAIEDLIPELPESEFAPWQLERLPAELKTALVNTNQSGDGGENIQTQYPNEPAFTVTQSADGRLRAFLVNTREMHGNDGAAYTAVLQDQPVYTIPSLSGASRHRAFLVNGALSGQDEKTLQIHDADEPTGTIVAGINTVKDTRAWLSQGRVVKMTPRCLARFQSFPDSYQLSGNNALDCKGIGNTCPPLLLEKIYRQLKGAAE